jgi:hypothetical protein
VLLRTSEREMDSNKALGGCQDALVLEIIEKVRCHYGLKEFSFRELDKFLWRYKAWMKSRSCRHDLFRPRVSSTGPKVYPWASTRPRRNRGKKPHKMRVRILPFWAGG